MFIRRIKLFLVFVLMSCVILTQSGCFGSFNLTRKVYNYNGAMGGRFLNTGVMYLFTFLPVFPLGLYTISFLLDACIYNVIEFWGGENPLTMSVIEKETKEVYADGRTFMVTVTQNQFHIEEPATAVITDVVYVPQTQRWQVFKNGVLVSE